MHTAPARATHYPEYTPLEADAFRPPSWLRNYATEQGILLKHFNADFSRNQIFGMATTRLPRQRKAGIFLQNYFVFPHLFLLR